MLMVPLIAVARSHNIIQCHTIESVNQNQQLNIRSLPLSPLRERTQKIGSLCTDGLTLLPDVDQCTVFVGTAYGFQTSGQNRFRYSQYQYIGDHMEMMENGPEGPKVMPVEDIKNVSEVLSVDQPQSKWQKFCNNVKVLKVNLIAEALRIAIYLLVGFGIFYAFERTTHISLHEQTYFSSEQVVYASQIRGLFPPIQGSHLRLIGKWRVSFTNSLEIPNNGIYNNFTIEFKSNNNIRIKRRGCDGDLFMNWHTFQYNMFIKDYNNEDIDREMIIEPETNDTLCITQDSTFIHNLKSVSVWTIHDNNLYLLAETWKLGKNMQYILLLEQIY